MKVLFSLILFASATMALADERIDSVYVSVQPTSDTFHLYSNCKELTACKEIRMIPLNNAKNEHKCCERCLNVNPNLLEIKVVNKREDNISGD